MLTMRLSAVRRGLRPPPAIDIRSLPDQLRHLVSSFLNTRDNLTLLTVLVRNKVLSKQFTQKKIPCMKSKELYLSTQACAGTLLVKVKNNTPIPNSIE